MREYDIAALAKLLRSGLTGVANTPGNLSYNLAKYLVRKGVTIGNVAYCIGCNDIRPYAVAAKKSDATVRGTTFSYMEQIAHCIQCGEEVYAPDVNDANCRAREEAYAECKVKLYELKRGDLFATDVLHPPIGVPVVITGMRWYYERKWYNPFSWFRKKCAYSYSYIGDITNGTSV